MASELKPELLSSVPEAIKKPITDQTMTEAHINGTVNQTKVFNFLMLIFYLSINLMCIFILVG